MEDLDNQPNIKWYYGTTKCLGGFYIPTLNYVKSYTKLPFSFLYTTFCKVISYNWIIV